MCTLLSFIVHTFCLARVSKSIKLTRKPLLTTLAHALPNRHDVFTRVPILVVLIVAAGATASAGTFPLETSQSTAFIPNAAAMLLPSLLPEGCSGNETI
jgi:hypothetical protein